MTYSVMRKKRCAAIATSLVLALSGHAGAQGLQLEPVSVELQAGQMASTVTVTNTTGSIAAVQLRPFQWTQRGGEDVLNSTDQLIVSPPMTQINPGQAQTFRIVLRQAPVGTEASYRILLDQLPSPSSAGSVRIALRLSFPVFARPAGRTAEQLVWKVVNQPDGVALVGVNLGTRHARVVNPHLTTGAGATINAKASVQLPYILPGSERVWFLEHPPRLPPGTALQLSATSSTGPIASTVRAEGP